MLNAVKHLANVSCKVPARDPSDAMLCQDDTHRGTICILGQLLYYLQKQSLPGRLCLVFNNFIVELRLRSLSNL